MPWPTMSLEPTTVYSSPTAPTTSCLGTFMTFAGLTSPYASSGESLRSFLSPTLSPSSALVEARDHHATADGEGDGLAALAGGVELLAVI